MDRNRNRNLFLDADEGQVPELAGIVEAVSDDELVLDLESDIFDGHIDLAAAWLAQQTGGSQRFRLAGAQDVLQIMQRQACIDDVFDDNDVAALQRRVEVFAAARTSPELLVAAP